MNNFLNYYIEYSIMSYMKKDNFQFFLYFYMRSVSEMTASEKINRFKWKKYILKGIFILEEYQLLLATYT